MANNRKVPVDEGRMRLSQRQVGKMLMSIL